MAITATYDWYGKTNTVQLTPHNYGHRFEHDGTTYQIERDAHRNHKWNVYRVTWNGDGARLTPVVELAPSRKQAIADTVMKAIVDGIEAEEASEEPAVVLPAADRDAPQGESNSVTEPTITRQPVHAGYDELGNENTPGEDYWLIIDGRNIGTTWYCNAHYVNDGQRWASDGPAGHSFGHRTREDAEQAQIDAYLANPGNVIDRTPPKAPAQPDLNPLPMTWEQALAEAKEHGVGRCSEPAVMAAFCQADIQYIVGAVSGQLIWEGAMKKGLSFKELGRLANRDPLACSELMWL